MGSIFSFQVYPLFSLGFVFFRGGRWTVADKQKAFSSHYPDLNFHEVTRRSCQEGKEKQKPTDGWSMHACKPCMVMHENAPFRTQRIVRVKLGVLFNIAQYFLLCIRCALLWMRVVRANPSVLFSVGPFSQPPWSCQLSAYP